MSRILVVGGTGVAGRQVATEAIRRGHEVSVASRRLPGPESPSFVAGVEYVKADLVTAAGLEEALDGIDVLVDTSNGAQRSSRPVFTDGALNLLHGAARWGVGHAVLLSIVNVDASSFAYYRAKAAQERIYTDSVLETRIVRTTQFHDFVTSFFESGSRFGLIPAFSRVRLQPIATTDVARFLIDAAEGSGDPNGMQTFGGPEVLTSREMAESWKATMGRRGAIVGIPLRGALGKVWRSGGNLAPERAVGTLRYADWLTEQA